MNDEELDDRDIYEILDKAGLSVASLMDSKRPMTRIVLEIRQSIVAQTKDYIQMRDINRKGVKK